MVKQEEDIGGTLLGKMKKEAVDALPPAPTAARGQSTLGLKPAGTLNQTKGMAGREAQDQLRSNFVSATDQGKQAYDPIIRQYGSLREGGDHGLSFEELHNLQMQAGAAARKAASQNKYADQAAAMREVHYARDRMENIAGARAMSDYNKVSQQYGKIMEQFDNPTVRQLREDVPSEQLVDVMLNPDKLRTFVPFREIETKTVGVPNRTMPTHQSISQEDAIHLVRQAVGEDKFKQLRADAIFHLAEGAKKESVGGVEMLDGKKAVGALQKLPEGVQDALLGKGPQQSINQIAKVTEHVQRTREGTGALWIIMKYPSSALTLASGLTTGLATGSTGLAATAMAGTVVVAPWAFQKILTNPGLTKLFVQTIAAPAGNMKSMAVKKLTAELVRAGASTAISGGIDDLTTPRKINGIPDPPTQ
jgi:hypothetical protein